MTSVRFGSASPTPSARTTIMLAVLAAVVLLFSRSRRTVQATRAA